MVAFQDLRSWGMDNRIVIDYTTGMINSQWDGFSFESYITQIFMQSRHGFYTLIVRLQVETGRIDFYRGVNQRFRVVLVRR
ncbi:hypothetical protein BDQ17DRAFT_857498 [Cyathus striatus]|nr:hypothetical protein BDQ17DRAFT_857498 [Cyathus striatus]